MLLSMVYAEVNMDKTGIALEKPVIGRQKPRTYGGGAS